MKSVPSKTPTAGIRKRRRRELHASLALLLWPLWLPTPASANGGGDAAGEPVQVLPALVEVAMLPEPYLVLDLGTPRLRMMYGGAVLRDYPVAAVEIGRPGALFVPRTAALPSSQRIWKLTRLDPERVYGRPVLYPAAPGAAVDEAVAIPPTPEEACPAPDRYLLRFEGGLSIEVRPDEPEIDETWKGLPRTLRWRLRDLGQSIALQPEIRIRLVLSRAEAGALYRSVPLSVKMVVLQESEPKV